MTHDPSVPTDEERTSARIVDAFSSGTACPTDLELARFSRGEMPSAERAVLQQHLEQCGGCSLEVETASRLSESEQEEPAAPTLELAQALEASPRWSDRAASARPPNTLRPPSPARRMEPPLRSRWIMALAAGLVGLLAVSLYTARAPQLPEPSQGMERGDSIDLVLPAGTLSERPMELRWRPFEGARSYRATLRDIRAEVLLTCVTGLETHCELPPDVGLEPFVSYSWRVEAYRENLADGALVETVDAVGRSAWADFSFRSQ